VIRVSNVLEHFTEPLKEFNKLTLKLKDKGVFVIEGPLEMNASLVNWLKWNYLKLRKRMSSKYVTFHDPTHIFFSDRVNQLHFFEKFDLITESFEIKENTWPYPENGKQINSAGMFIKYVIGQLSLLIGAVVPVYGNTFLYVGRKK